MFPFRVVEPLRVAVTPLGTARVTSLAMVGLETLMLELRVTVAVETPLPLTTSAATVSAASRLLHRYTPPVAEPLLL